MPEHGHLVQIIKELGGGGGEHSKAKFSKPYHFI